MHEQHQGSPRQFFISYNPADHLWAQWIVWQLESVGHSTIFRDRDFLPGSNFVLKMHNALKEVEHIIAVLSPDYLKSKSTQNEWSVAFDRDPTGDKGILLPIHVRACANDLKGLFSSIVYIDFVGQDKSTARERLLTAVYPGQPRITTPPVFPGTVLLSTDQQLHISVDAIESIWNVPHQRNPFFTAREKLLKDLHKALKEGKVKQPQAICGLGGTGKTQVAIEYT
jgi:hypothetical protein